MSNKTPAEIRKIQELLAKLGLAYRDKPRVYNRFLIANLKRSGKTVIRELQEMLLARDAAIQQAQEFLAENQLTATGPTISWNESFLCLELKYKIQGSPSANVHSYEGRDLEIKIMHGASNNNFNIDDIRKKYAVRIKAALALDSRINTEFPELLVEMNEIINDFDRQPLSTIISRTTDLNNKLMINLAVNLIRAEQNDPNYNPSKSTIKDKITKLQNQMKEDISNTQRAVKIVAYPQTTGNSKQSQWILSQNSPYSDKSSDDRDFASNLVISNDWRFKFKPLKFTYNKQKKELELQQGREIEGNRSSSAVRLHPEIDATAQANKEESEVKALIALLIKEAREDLIVRLNRGEKITSVTIQTAYISLLTPLMDFNTARTLIRKYGISGKLRDTLLSGNEQEQMMAFSKAIEIAANNDKLRFSDQDIRHILAHTNRATHKMSMQDLTGLKIEHRYFFSNFMVNTFKGIDLGNVSNLKSGYNYQYNLQGIKKLNACIDQYLLSINSNYGYLFSHKNATKTWKNFKAHLQHSLKRMTSPEDKNVRDIIQLYIRLRDYFESQKTRRFLSWKNITKPFTRKSKNSHVVESYFAAATEQAIATLMGYKVRSFCKSGKDRTGLFMAILEAQAGPPEMFKINLCNALKFSDIKDLIETNRPGSRGVQVDADVMDGLVEYFDIKSGHNTPFEAEHDPELSFRQLLEQWQSRKIGGMDKSAEGDVLNAYMAGNPPNRDFDPALSQSAPSSRPNSLTSNSSLGSGPRSPSPRPASLDPRDSLISELQKSLGQQPRGEPDQQNATVSPGRRRKKN